MDFEENSVVDGKPVEPSEDRCYIVTFLGLLEQFALTGVAM